MRVRLAVALALVAAAAISVAVASPGVPRISSVSRIAACGVERWDVKTLTDPDKDKVKLTPKKTTIEKLRKMKVPLGLNQDSPRFAQERKTYRVKALLMSVKLEKDSDLHLVIADPRVGGSMIVEFPASDCIGANAHDQIVNARKALKDACHGVPKKVGAQWTLSGKATIAGVAFFDLLHGQGGVAPNGIELHPVLDLASSECSVVHH
jgi:hypothetical protein